MNNRIPGNVKATSKIISEEFIEMLNYLKEIYSEFYSVEFNIKEKEIEAKNNKRIFKFASDTDLSIREYERVISSIFDLVQF